MKFLSAGPLQLEPLVGRHASLMFPLLSDTQLYEFLDDKPPVSVVELAERYRRLEARRSPEGDETWLNWVVRTETGEPVGTVQATVFAGNRAWVGFVIGREFWGRGYGRISTGAVLQHLSDGYGVTQFLACSERNNHRSLALLQHLGFRLATPEQATGYELTDTEVLLICNEVRQHGI